MLSICRQQADGVSKKVVSPDVLGTGNKATIKLLLQRFRVSRGTLKKALRYYKPYPLWKA